MDGLHRDVKAIGRGADLNRVHARHRVLDGVGGAPGRICGRPRHVDSERQSMGSALSPRHYRWIIWPLAHELVADPHPVMDWVNAHIADPDRLIAHRLDRPRRSAHCDPTWRNRARHCCALSDCHLAAQPHPDTATNGSANLGYNRFAFG